MQDTRFFDFRLSAGFLTLLVVAVVISPCKTNADETTDLKPRKIRAHVQPRPGRPPQDVDMTVHPVPVDLPTVPADEALFGDDELVLGVVVDGQAVAYPIRYLAMFEVVNGRVGKTPVAPSW